MSLNSPCGKFLMRFRVICCILCSFGFKVGFKSLSESLLNSLKNIQENQIDKQLISNGKISKFKIIVWDVTGDVTSVLIVI